MKTKILAAVGAAAFALTMSASASYAGYMQPGETMGVSLVSPLPEGVFFADLEDYGRVDNVTTATANVGVNIPVLIWSTPYSFYNTRLEFIGGLPFVHLDNSGGVSALNQVGLVSLPFGPMFAHDFGNGLTGGIAPLLRTPGASPGVKQVLGETTTELDLRESLQYTFKGPGILNGITAIQNAAYTTAFSANYYGFTHGVQNDEFSGDFTLEKTFDKFTIGFTGYGNIDTDDRNFGAGRVSHVAVGGLVAYDFGRFSLTGIVTRDIYNHNSNPLNPANNGLGLPGAETRGWLRLIVPLYVAPTAPVVTARY